MKRVIVLIVSLLLVGVILCGCSCGTAQIKRTTPDDPSKVVTVTGSCDTAKEGGNITVHCKTDMMDGTIVKLSLDSYNGTVLASKVATISKGEASASFAVESSWSGTAYGNAVIVPNSNGNQTDEFYNKYGKKMQYIESNSLIWNTEGNIIIFQSEKLEL